ncbi:MAG: YvcK family protein [Chloroflexi bacterium]|nr:YvcK family protein [Chloroflexota bacterium]
MSTRRKGTSLWRRLRFFVVGNIRAHVKWLAPGLHVKRWLVLLVFGVTFVSLGIAYLMTHYYRTQPFPEEVYFVTLQFIDRAFRGAVFLLLGGAISAFALVQLARSLVSPFVSRDRAIVDRIREHRHLSRGPRIVAIGGGHGLSTLLRGLKQHTQNLTAVVTVTDDGGSSGRLRRDLGVLPPGDIRMCLVALADAEPLMTRLFQYRFERGDGLEGHSFGNLFLAAMNEITGNFERAVRESSRVLAVRGQILPSTLEDIDIGAEYCDGEIVVGESQLPLLRKAIRRLFLRPADPPAYPEAIKAILEADLIVIGPGSLYTSILPNLLVQGISDAVRKSMAMRIYICNVATQRGETDDYGVFEHIQAIEGHCGPGLFDHVLVNNNSETTGCIGIESSPVRLNRKHRNPQYHLIEADVIDVGHPHFHDGAKLAEVLVTVYASGGQLPSWPRTPLAPV